MCWKKIYLFFSGKFNTALDRRKTSMTRPTEEPIKLKSDEDGIRTRALSE